MGIEDQSSSAGHGLGVHGPTFLSEFRDALVRQARLFLSAVAVSLFAVGVVGVGVGVERQWAKGEVIELRSGKLRSACCDYDSGCATFQAEKSRVWARLQESHEGLIGIVGDLFSSEAPPREQDFLREVSCTVRSPIAPEAPPEAFQGTCLDDQIRRLPHACVSACHPSCHVSARQGLICPSPELAARPFMYSNVGLHPFADRSPEERARLFAVGACLNACCKDLSASAIDQAAPGEHALAAASATRSLPFEPLAGHFEDTITYNPTGGSSTWEFLVQGSLSSIEKHYHKILSNNNAVTEMKHSDSTLVDYTGGKHAARSVDITQYSSPGHIACRVSLRKVASENFVRVHILWSSAFILSNGAAPK